ncbi:MAG TPA: response regulator [Planctomycetota bacterium]|nr:response regulator [Planctomycetota bacterium]
MQRLLTTNEIGKLVGVSERTVANWIDRGYLSAFRTPGGHRRVDPKILSGFLVKRGLPVPEFLDERSSILIVEDDVQVGETLKTWLEQPGDPFQVKLLHDGVSALLDIGARKPRLVLLDVLMPGMDGIEVCRKIKADAALGDVQVLFVTAHRAMEPADLAKETGAAGVLLKPVRKQELRDSVARILGRMSLSAATE